MQNYFYFQEHDQGGHVVLLSLFNTAIKQFFCGFRKCKYLTYLKQKLSLPVYNFNVKPEGTAKVNHIKLYQIPILLNLFYDDIKGTCNTNYNDTIHSLIIFLQIILIHFNR